MRPPLEALRNGGIDGDAIVDALVMSFRQGSSSYWRANIFSNCSPVLRRVSLIQYVIHQSKGRALNIIMEAMPAELFPNASFWPLVGLAGVIPLRDQARASRVLKISPCAPAGNQSAIYVELESDIDTLIQKIGTCQGLSRETKNVKIIDVGAIDIFENGTVLQWRPDGFIYLEKGNAQAG